MQNAEVHLVRSQVSLQQPVESHRILPNLNVCKWLGPSINRLVTNGNRSTKTRAGHNVREGIVTGFLNTVTSVSDDVGAILGA